MGRFSEKKSERYLPLKHEIYRERFLRRSVFEQHSKRYNNNFGPYNMSDKTRNRLSILTGLVVVLVLTYHYNIMRIGMNNGPWKEKIHVEFEKPPNATPSTLPLKLTTNKKMQTQKPSSTFLNTRPKRAEVNMILTRVYTMKRMKVKTPRFAPVVVSDNDCRMHLCFNYTRCSLTGGFPIYIYDLNLLYNGTQSFAPEIVEMLSANNHITQDPDKACLFIVIAFPFMGVIQSTESYKLVNKEVFHKLPYWGRDGRNHVLLNLGQTGLVEGTGFAIVAQSLFTHSQYRPGFDIVVPPVHGPLKKEVWNQCPAIAPAIRVHLLSFHGPRHSDIQKNPEREALVKFLQELEWFGIHNFRFQFHCKKEEMLSDHWIDDWPLCSTRKSRRNKLGRSTFVLIIAPVNYVYVSTNLLQTRLYEALEVGAVPVILGGDRIRLPFEEVLDWRKAVIRLPMARVTELKYLLEHISDEDILAFRKQGRMLWERYLATVKASMDTLLAVIRTRLDIPPRPAMAERPSVYQLLGFEDEIKSFEILNIAGTTSEELAVFNARKSYKTAFKRNFTVALLHGYELWNSWGDPFALYPELPWDPLLPLEARYLNSSVSQQYHNSCSPLAGDRPLENFTVVILTYSSDRKTMLDMDISRLSMLPYLNKIVVVCNGPKPTTENWPTNIPIVVVKGEKNSLNNRFLPFNLIETEAVFSVDDDAVPPSLDEIVFAFKVWREHRDQIVGFFGRNFEWIDLPRKGYVYLTRYRKVPKNRNTVCEVSMVLTGSAFLHRYYLRAYWRQLPHSVRRFVDKHNNCEDIAMNFLVADITKKPPIKVSSMWAEAIDRIVPTYSKLSRNTSHYLDRNNCMNFFSQVMGYNPLLSVHYRVSPFASMKSA